MRIFTADFEVEGGNGSVPFFIFNPMAQETIIASVTQKLEALLQENPAHFIVAVRIKPTNNIKVFLDGDTGIGIDELVRYNRALYRQLEEEALFPEGDFSLELSSAGLDEPLQSLRQYSKNTGRHVAVQLQDGTQLAGRLLQVSSDGITVEETKGKGKKAETIQHTVLFDHIKTTKIQIKF